MSGRHSGVDACSQNCGPLLHQQHSNGQAGTRHDSNGATFRRPSIHRVGPLGSTCIRQSGNGLFGKTCPHYCPMKVRRIYESTQHLSVFATSRSADDDADYQTAYQSARTGAVNDGPW
jgi:hypothetical protein